MHFNRLGTRIAVLVLCSLIVAVSVVAFSSMRISGQGLTRMSINYELSVAGENAENINGIFTRYSQTFEMMWQPASIGCDKAKLRQIGLILRLKSFLCLII